MPDTPRVFAYIIRTVGAGYRLNGAVPWVSGGKVFFGACKKRMRPDVQPGDYIMGISGAGAGRPRRVLLWMKVDKRMTFKDAYDRGETDKAFRDVRGTAIHVRPRNVPLHHPGDPGCYEHIPGAPHSDEWESDLKGKRDVFLTGTKGSWVAAEKGPEVTAVLVDLLRDGINWKGNVTVTHPLTENARGKHALVVGTTARQIISWIPRGRIGIGSESGPRSACSRKCSCD